MTFYPRNAHEFDSNHECVSCYAEERPDFTTPIPELKPVAFPTIVLVSGKQRTGKDTIAELLVQHFGYKHIGLADSIYTIVANQLNISVGELRLRAHGKRGSATADSSRGLLQDVGMSFVKYDPLHWCGIVWRQMNNRNAERFVISDVRFPHELDFFFSENELREARVHVMRLHAPDEERLLRGASIKKAGHPSETALDGLAPEEWEELGGYYDTNRIRPCQIIHHFANRHGGL